MSVTTIRRVASTSDVDAACELLSRFFAEEGFGTPVATIIDNARRMSTLEDLCLMLLAWVDDVPVGVATVSLDFGIEFGWLAEMGDLYVVPPARGQGVSVRLMEAGMQWARERGASSLAVTVTVHGALQGLDRFYDRLQFEDDGRRILLRSL